MFEHGFITVIWRCIHYLLCRKEHGIYESSERLLRRLETEGAILRRISMNLYGYDKEMVWERLICQHKLLVRVMTYRRIESIDDLLFRSWDYYDMDMSGNVEYGDELASVMNDKYMETVSRVSRKYHGDAQILYSNHTVKQSTKASSKDLN